MMLSQDMAEKISANRLAALDRKRARELAESRNGQQIGLSAVDIAESRAHKGLRENPVEIPKQALSNSADSEGSCVQQRALPNWISDRSSQKLDNAGSKSSARRPGDDVRTAVKQEGSIVPLSESHELSEEQQQVRNQVLSGKSCFLTGCGGTGKSFLTARLIADLKQKYGPFAVAVTATTGIAACHIKGTSLHSFAGIGLGQGTADELITRVKKNKQSSDRWLLTKCLVIDEISMLDGALFDKLDCIARSLRKRSEPFGGIQLLLVGDFAQLPPVSKGGKVDFCFESRAWSEAIQLQVELRKVFRQSNMEFVKMLSSIRVGVCTPEITAKLNATRHNTLNESGGVEATRLFSKNIDVEAINLQRVMALPGELLTLTAQDAGNSPHREALEKNCMAPAKLLLKRGAQVMLLKNLETGSGLTNGARGVFEDVVEVEDKGRVERALRVLFETRNGLLPLEVRKEIFSMEVSGKVVASRSQYPLRLAYAITIHKCQGMTLSKAELSLEDVFEYGQAYVALSRVSDLAGLRLLTFSPAVVKCHPTVLQFYGSIAPAASPIASPARPPSQSPAGHDVIITKITQVSDPVAFIELDSDEDPPCAPVEPRVQPTASQASNVGGVAGDVVEAGGDESIELEMVSEEELEAIEAALSQSSATHSLPQPP